MRPPRLVKDPDLARQIHAVLAAGNPVRVACWATGVAEASFYAWQEKGEAIAQTVAAAEDPEAARAALDEVSRAYLEFSEGVKKARATAVLKRVKVIQEAAEDGTWTAAAWWLERMYPDDFGRRERVEVSGRVSRDPLSEAALTDDEVRTLIDDLLARIAGGGDPGCPGDAE